MLTLTNNRFNNTPCRIGGTGHFLPEVAYEALEGLVMSVILNAPEEYANTQTDTALANAENVGYTGDKDTSNLKTQWQDVVGMTTSDGYTVREIKDHIQERAIDRNIGVSDIADALKQPLHKTDVTYNVNNEPSVQYIGRKATVAYNPETGAVITTWKTGKDKLKEYGG